MTENVRCEIYCQKGKSLYREFPLNTKGYETDGILIEIKENAENGYPVRKDFSSNKKYIQHGKLQSEDGAPSQSLSPVGMS